jgi:zinc/manganese transport system permease protein
MNPHFTLDLAADARELLAYPFMVNALQAAGVAAVMAAVTGWFMVLRRETFAGHTLSMMSFPGAAAAALAGLPPAAGYFAFCVAGALLIAATAAAGTAGGAGGHSAPGRGSEAQRAAAIGTVGAAALALGFVLLSLYGGVLESLESLLFGSIFGVTHGQVVALAIVAACALAALAILGRPLLFASVDGALAAASGVPVPAVTTAFLVVLGLAVAATAQITGVLLVFALLVAPAAIVRELTPRIALGLGLSVALGLTIAWVGLALSYFTNYSAGFFTTSVAVVLFAATRAARRLRAVRR